MDFDYHSGLLSNKFESIVKDAWAVEIQNKNRHNIFFFNAFVVCVSQSLQTGREQSMTIDIN